MVLKSCCICLKEREKVKPLNLQDEKETKLVKKLNYIAPEFEWQEVFSICSNCNIQLNTAYCFKQLCASSDSFRKEFNHEIYSVYDEEDNLCSEDVLDTKHEDGYGPEISKIELDSCEINNLSSEKFICFHCERKFTSKSLLENHINLKHSSNVCGICTNSFDTKKGLKLHIKDKHQETPPPKFHCKICGKHFSLLKSILEHCTTLHSMDRKEVKPYCCDQCDSKFTSGSLLIQHKKYHKGVRAFVCTTCGKSFITRRDLTGHEKLHDNDRNYHCDKCDKSFKTSQNLNTHIYVVHTDPSQWKHSCPICFKRFAMKSHCNEHIKRHEGNKDFACHICNKTFVSNHELKKHVKLHSNNFPFKCSHCSKHYGAKRYLDIHLTKIHGIGTAKVPVRIKKFVCHICPSQFYDNRKLQRHIRTHTGVKPFSCQECDKRFIDKSYLSRHLKNVHKVLVSVKTEDEGYF